MHKIFKFVCSAVTFVSKRQTLGWTITKCKYPKVSTNVHYHYDDNDDDESVIAIMVFMLLLLLLMKMTMEVKTSEAYVIETFHKIISTFTVDF